MKILETSTILISTIEELVNLVIRALAAWKKARELLRRNERKFAYENLFLDTVLDIRDRLGRNAVLDKRQGVLFRSTESAAVRDLIWGEGEPLARYRVRGAKRLHLEPDGPRQVVVLGVDHKPAMGEKRFIKSRRLLRNAFTRGSEYFEMMVERPTKRISMKVLFPRSRPPKAVYGVTSPPDKTVKKVAVRYTAERRPFLSWKVQAPEPFTNYSLRWSW